MRKVAKAAKFLSQFKMIDVTQCSFTVYFAYANGDIEGVGLDYHPGYEKYLSCHADFRHWTQQQFAESITDPENRDNKSKDAEVVAIVVSFEVPDDNNLYVLECTDFKTMNRFNRLIIENNYKKSIEVYLTPKESQTLHSTADIIKLCGKISSERHNANYEGDTPIVVKNHKGEQISDGFIRPGAIA